MTVTNCCDSENHHIIPKSCGGLNDKNNMIRLTAKEHFIGNHLVYFELLNIMLFIKWSITSSSKTINHKWYKLWFKGGSFQKFQNTKTPY